MEPLTRLLRITRMRHNLILCFSLKNIKKEKIMIMELANISYGDMKSLVEIYETLKNPVNETKLGVDFKPCKVEPEIFINGNA